MGIESIHDEFYKIINKSFGHKTEITLIFNLKKFKDYVIDFDQFCIDKIGIIIYSIECLGDIEYKPGKKLSHFSIM